MPLLRGFPSRERITPSAPMDSPESMTGQNE